MGSPNFSSFGLNSMKTCFPSMDYSVKEKILSFNKTNENYRIEVRDYSGYDDSARKLNLDITSGKVPDILDVSYGISKDALVKKGLLSYYNKILLLTYLS